MAKNRVSRGESEGENDENKKAPEKSEAFLK
jgi:hypothetical protein